MDLQEALSRSAETKQSRINLDKKKFPPVDIVVPFHNQYDSLLKCYSAIQNFTPNLKYFVYLVDDASGNKNFIDSFSKDKQRTFCIRSEEHVGFSAAVHAGILSGDSPLVCVMHSDVIVENIFWLKHLIESLEEAQSNQINFISAKLTSPGSASDYPENLLSPVSDENTVPSDKPLPWTCCIFSRKFYKQLGGLKKYFPAWYEDVEYFHRMKKRGFYQGICNKTMVKHIGSKTINEIVKYPKMKKMMEENAHLCLRDIR